jgi:hypothetical protein
MCGYRDGLLECVYFVILVCWWLWWGGFLVMYDYIWFERC